MQIVDAQIHLWQGSGAPPHHRLGRETYSYDEALRDMDAAGVDAAINCPPIWDDTANGYAVEAVLAHPGRFATLDWFDLTDPDVHHLLDVTLARPGVIGLRFLTATPKAPVDPTNTLSRINWPSDGRLDWLWGALAARAVPVTLYGNALLPRVRWIAEHHPTLRLTIDHFGTIGNTAPDGALSQMPDLLDLSSLPNIAVKLTAAPSYAVGGYPYISVHPAVRELYAHYGPHRLFWGTDITRLNASWRESVTMFTEHMPWLSRGDLTLIMGQAICDWHGWQCKGYRTVIRSDEGQATS